MHNASASGDVSACAGEHVRKYFLWSIKIHHTTEVSSGRDFKSIKRYASCNSRALFISNLTSLVSLCIFRQEEILNKNSEGDKKCNPSKRIVGASLYICYRVFNFSRTALREITSVIADYAVGIIYWLHVPHWRPTRYRTEGNDFLFSFIRGLLRDLRFSLNLNLIFLTHFW